MQYLISKRQMAQQLLATNQTVRIVLNSCVAEVDIPDNLLGRDQVALDVGYRMPVPIPDLYLSEQGFCGTLMFKGCPRYVFVPWTAIYSIHLVTTGRGAVWGQDMPATVQARLVASARSPVGVTPKSHVPDHSGKVISMDAYRARKAQKDGLS